MKCIRSAQSYFPYCPFFFIIFCKKYLLHFLKQTTRWAAEESYNCVCLTFHLTSSDCLCSSGFYISAAASSISISLSYSCFSFPLDVDNALGGLGIVKVGPDWGSLKQWWGTASGDYGGVNWLLRETELLLLRSAIAGFSGGAGFWVFWVVFLVVFWVFFYACVFFCLFCFCHSCLVLMSLVYLAVNVFVSQDWGKQACLGSEGEKRKSYNIFSSMIIALRSRWELPPHPAPLFWNGIPIKLENAFICLT